VAVTRPDAIGQGPAYDSSGQKIADSTTGDLDDRHRRSKAARLREERKWLLQLSYYVGNQWVAVDRTGRLYEPELDPYKLKLVDNRIQPSVIQQVAKMTKHRPIITVVPRTADQEDVEGAELATEALDWAWGNLDLTRKRRQAILWSRVCSAGFWKLCWDDKKGDPFSVIDVEDQQGRRILTDPYGRPMGADDPAAAVVLQNLPPDVAGTAGQRTLYPGEIAVHVRSPFSIFPDPLTPEEGLEDSEWVVEETVQSAPWVKARYDIELPDDSSSQAGVLEARMPGWDSDVKQGVVVREFWAPKGSEFPNGKHCVWAGNRILRESDNPYGWLPYVMFRGTPVPGRFWPTCFTEQAISPQTELNKTLSQIAENQARISNPPLAQSRQSDVEWDGLPGSRILFDDTLANSLPQFLQVPEMPIYVRERVPQIIETLAELAGQHEVSQGNVPTGVTAAAAINLLQEADDTRLGPDIEDMEKTLEDAGRRILQLMSRYYSDDRVMALGGQDQAYDIRRFKGQMLHGNDDVDVQAGSGMPRSKAAKQAQMQETLALAIQNGMELDQRSLRRFFKDFEVGGLETLLGELSMDETQVRREHQVLLSGGQLGPPNDFDNHEYHADEHDDFRKGTAYQRLDPNLRAMLDEHVRLHRQTLEQARQAQMQEQMQQQITLAQATRPPTQPQGGQ
jgi:hypothetical protein